jgi:drug/metabolite transporter (DMT)-like permease
MGIFLGLVSAILFGASAVWIRVGMRARRMDNGHFMSVVMNCVVIGGVTLIVRLPRWNWSGVALLLLAGAMTTFMARGTGYAAIRRIGPSRQSAILLSAPVFAALVGWVGLGEAIQPHEALGGSIVIIGLLLLIRIRGGGPGGAGDGARTAERSRFVRGTVFALASAAMFGAGFVVRKLALARFDSAIAGAFIGALAALSLIIATSGLKGQLERLVHDNVRRVPVWFIAGGLASSLGLMAQFSALQYLQAWVVSLLQATQVCWTVLLSYLFLREEEGIGRPLLLSIALVLSGVTVMTLKP